MLAPEDVYKLLQMSDERRLGNLASDVRGTMRRNNEILVEGIIPAALVLRARSESTIKALFTLASAGNTTNPAFCILKRKGYDLSLEITREERCFYIAFKEGRRFVGDSAPELLGLVSIWEELGDNWRDKLSDLPDIVPEIRELEFDEHSLESREP